MHFSNFLELTVLFLGRKKYISRLKSLILFIINIFLLHFLFYCITGIFSLHGTLNYYNEKTNSY